MIRNIFDRVLARARQYENWLILLAGLALAAGLRLSLIELETLDFQDFTGRWVEFIQAEGGWPALGADFANYTPPYLYLLVVTTGLFGGLSRILAVKSIAVLFDFAAAFFVARIVRRRYRSGSLPLFAFLAVLFTPTVFFNSAFWGQADVIYTTGLVATLYYLLAGREKTALVAFGLAFAFKLQALFLLPFLFILWLRGKVSWRSFLLVPVVYMLAMVPAWLAGRPPLDLLLIYAGQADFYRALTMNAANLYQWLPNDQYDILVPAGLAMAAAAVLFFVGAVYKSRARLTPEVMVQLALLSVLIMPFFLPKMHDRYYFPADVLSLVYGFYFPRYFFIPLVVVMTSFFSYGPFLFGREVIPLPFLALVPVLTLAILARHLAITIRQQYPPNVG